MNPSHMPLADFANRPEMKAYLNEFGLAVSALKKKVDDAKSQNVAPDVCPPKEMKVDIAAILADAHQLPAEWQSRPFADSFIQVIKNHYPCPSLTPAAAP